jgi:outer membrane protein OmpA-like peptidoglycan-associated protein
MTKNKYLLGIFASLTLSANAQKEKAAETAGGAYNFFAADQTEIGIGLGATLIHGDFGRGFNPGFGVSAHLRKALDYTWALRGEVGYESLVASNSTGKNLVLATGQPDGAGSILAKDVKTTVFRGTLQVVASLNNNRWENGIRRFNPYVYFGAGVGSYSTTVNGSAALANVSEAVSPIMEVGGGISYRVSDKMNLSFDTKLSSLFGKRTDLIDAFEYKWRDMTSYMSVRANFNLGGGDAKTAKSLPLWWVNPAAKINSDMAEISARPKLDLTDTDGDGIIDMLDQEKDTPAGARVDTRGVSLDSDGDGVPDYKDKEPFSPIGHSIDKATGIAQVAKPNYITQAEVDKIVSDKLKVWEVANSNRTPDAAVGRGTTTTSSIADWFLPMIHFDFGSPAIRQAEIGNLYNVATVMKNNPNIKIVVSGYTDKVSDEASNQALSYHRAQNAIDYLVKKFGIDRSRLVLTYGGEKTLLVDTKAQNLMNRRVEFKVAQSETEMGAPAKAGKKYKGNKGAGY